MLKLLSIGFTYQGVQNYTIIRVKEKDDHIEYHVTVMNGELEKILYGDHIIVEKAGKLEVQDEKEDSQQAKLKFEITNALKSYLTLHPLQAGDFF